MVISFERSIQELAPSLKCVPIYGGTDYRYQTEQLNKKVDVICATPGRLKDLMQKKNFVNEKVLIL